MNEHSFIRSIHRKLPPDIYVWKINDNFQGGVADAYYSMRGGRDLWIEYKFLKELPKRADTVVRFGLSELQKDWLRQRHLDGRTVAVVVGSPQGSLILPGTSWDTDVTAEAFKGSAVATADVVAYICSRASEPVAYP